MAFACRLLCGLLPCAFGCNDLPRVPASVCGNGITEPPEECDTYAPEGQRCRAPGLGVQDACRFECSAQGDGEPTCPAGSACGIDGLCRFFTNTYESWGGLLPVVAASMQLGDFDGDGRDDLLALGNTNSGGQSMPRIYFFDESGRAADPFDPQTPVRSPLVTARPAQSSTGDRRQRIVFATDFGIATLEATPTRTVLPIAYPYQVVPEGWSYRVLRVRGSSVSVLGDGILLILGSDAPDQTRFVPAEPPDFPGPLAVLDEPLEDFAGEVLAGDVIEGARSPCDEAVWATRAERSVRMLELCDAAGNWKITTAAPQTVLELPKGHGIGHAMRLTRVDADEHLDLLVADGQGAAYLGFGLGDGRFVANPADPQGTLGEAWPVTTTAGHCDALPGDPGFPLAVGDLNSDGLPDWVTAAGVILTQSLAPDAPSQRVAVAACPGNGPFVGEWSQAGIADLNGDGRPDLVAGSTSVPALDFYAGTGRDRMNPRPAIATQGPIRTMTVGDFDGDLVEDLAFGMHARRADETQEEETEKVAIAFGSRSGDPTAPVEVGQFSEILQLASAHYATQDAIAELGVLGRSSDYEGESLTVFVGNPGRHPVASLGLLHIATAEDDRNTSQLPIACAVGRFSGNESLRLLALGIEDDPTPESLPRLWYADGSVLTRLSKPVPSAELPTELCAWQTAQADTPPVLLAGDVDGDGEEEALILGPASKQDTLGLWRVRVPEQGEGASWLTADPGSLVTRLWTGPGRLVRASAPKLIDLDDNGRLDLVLIVADAEGEQRLGVVWNGGKDGKGRLKLSELERVSLADSALGFAAASDGRVTRWVAVTRARAYGISLESSQGGARSLAATPIENAPGGWAIALGDLNGDGLMDLVIAGQSGVRVLAEVPREP
ncbi:MAG: VCBS repeat-containing protein [Polyangiaceae bacterium]|nr:VCBS repeat-containing protein [Polyangiaceae bacterium]